MGHFQLLDNLGIGLEEYGAMLSAQAGLCAICARTATRRGQVKALAVDHCHDTGRVRGLLCYECNTGLGKLGDDPARLRAAADYIEHHRSLAHNVIPLKKASPDG